MQQRPERVQLFHGDKQVLFTGPLTLEGAQPGIQYFGFAPEFLMAEPAHQQDIHPIDPEVIPRPGRDDDCLAVGRAVQAYAPFGPVRRVNIRQAVETLLHHHPFFGEQLQPGRAEIPPGIQSAQLERDRKIRLRF